MSGEHIAKDTEASEEFIWLKATYHFHVFHYRMPGTVAIAGVTPFVPSPLTIKMAMIASLFQLGDAYGAEIIAKNMHKIEVKIVPPKAALSFKAFLRYKSPPAKEKKEKTIDETGSFYPNRPHIREYAIFQGDLKIFVKLPVNAADYGKKALKNIRYLGSKDSMVTCLDVREHSTLPHDSSCVNKLESGNPGIVVILADFKFKDNSDIQELKLEELIPGNRKNKEMYENFLYTVPGKILTKGRTKIFLTN